MDRQVELASVTYDLREFKQHYVLKKAFYTLVPGARVKFYLKVRYFFLKIKVLHWV